MSYQLIAVGHSDVGRQRQNNEDSFLMLNHHQLWVVADGMGGHAAGQIASQIAVDEIAHFLTSSIYEPNFRWPFEHELHLSIQENALSNAIRTANLRIYNRSLKDPKCFGMGTTVITALYAQGNLWLASVGDSRCYCYRDQKLQQLTIDHSLYNHLVHQLKMSPQEAREKAGSNVIIRAVGLEDDVLVDVQHLAVQDHDLYLLCSDGLTDLVDHHQIIQTIEQYKHALDILVQTLINLANYAGGNDNITVIVIQVRADATPPVLR
jgi:PPM family protein phosphatase